MDDEFLDPMTPSDFDFPEQRLGGEVIVKGIKPVMKEKKSIETVRNPKYALYENRKMIKDKDGNDIVFEGYQEMNKNKTTAKRFPGSIFLGTDGNYYKSVKNRSGNYIWELLEKN